MIDIGAVVGYTGSVETPRQGIFVSPLFTYKRSRIFVYRRSDRLDTGEIPANRCLDNNGYQGGLSV